MHEKTQQRQTNRARTHAHAHDSGGGVKKESESECERERKREKGGVRRYVIKTLSRVARTSTHTHVRARTSSSAAANSARRRERRGKGGHRCRAAAKRKSSSCVGGSRKGHDRWGEGRGGGGGECLRACARGVGFHQTWKRAKKGSGSAVVRRQQHLCARCLRARYGVGVSAKKKGEKSDTQAKLRI